MITIVVQHVNNTFTIPHRIFHFDSPSPKAQIESNHSRASSQMLSPKGPNVPTRSSNVHFHCNYLSSQTVKERKILITTSHISLEENPMVTFSKF